jgi:hypothetical protein
MDLGMITGDGFLLKNDIIVELTAKPGHILGEGGDLLVDDQENIFHTALAIFSLRIHRTPRFSAWK